MYKKGFTEIEDMLMREHKAEGGMLGEEMKEKKPMGKPMMGAMKVMKRVITRKMPMKRQGGMEKKTPDLKNRMVKDMDMDKMNKGGKTRCKKADGGRNMAFKKPEMLLNANRTGFAAGAIGKVRKGEY